MSKIIIGIVVAMVLATTAAAMNYDSMIKPAVKQIFDVGLYHTNVCAYVNDELTGCEHNIWMDLGKNATAQYLGNVPGASGFKLISLGNGTTPAAGDTGLNNEINDCGLANVTGEYEKLGANIANWTIGNQWTSSCDGVTVNTTGLFNGTGGTYFAGSDFTDANLNNGDKLTVNYTIWIT